MSRHPRLGIPGVALHVRQRGNDRQNCFRHDNDRLVYLSMLRDLSRVRRCAIHTYCLMTNHVHLLLTPADDVGCALMMRDLGRCYAAYFNRRYEKTGALWEHPFRSCLVDSAEYVMTCYRYIERNPVRAQMVAQPADYPWSSYAGNACLRSDSIVEPHAEYLALGRDEASRPRAYRDLLNDVDAADSLKALRDATDAGFPLVGVQLKSELERVGARLERGTSGRRASDSDGDATSQLTLLTE